MNEKRARTMAMGGAHNRRAMKRSMKRLGKRSRRRWTKQSLRYWVSG